MIKELVNQTAQTKILVEDGELVSFEIKGKELMHRKGGLGWQHTEIEMFPTIGPTRSVDFKVPTAAGVAKLDQHGMLRVLSYELIEETKTTLVYQKSYTANTPLENPKYKSEGDLKELSWPYDFVFTKTFNLTAEGVTVDFNIKGKEMPFMLGYHPAFKVNSPDKAFLKIGAQKVSLKEVMDIGSPAMPFENCDTVIFEEAGVELVKVETVGFNQMMLWSEYEGMICIEPITFYPNIHKQETLHLGFRTIQEEENLRVKISPL